MKGCEACEATKPEVDLFEKRHPEIHVERFDVVTTPWPPNLQWTPPAYPTFTIVAEGLNPPRAIVGQHTADQLETWLLRIQRGGV